MNEIAYRIAVEAVAGRVRASIDDLVVADSDGVKLMRETYERPRCYFPKSDVAEGLLAPSPFRTFCPFKGTAHHWHLTLPGRTIENGAWSYEAPMTEAVEVGGYIAFYPHAVSEQAADGLLPEAAREQVAGSPLIDWLLREAWLCRSVVELTDQFGQRLLVVGVPLWRLNVNLWALHPELAGQRLTWTREGDGVVESDTPHGILQHPNYLNSPVRHVSEGLGGIRQRLDVDDPEFQFPIMDELRAGGGTDYVAMPLPFSDGQFQTMSMATDHRDGFSTAQLGQIFECVISLGRFYEVLTLRRNATVLFDTYLGRRIGRQVLGGLTRRGDGEEIRAAILYCDLRNSTALAASLSRDSYMTVLNDFFDRAVAPVLDGGGEVLKFIGDAVLAVFPLEGDAGEEAAMTHACTAARTAAQEIVDRIAAVPARAGCPAIQCAIGLHVGDLMYGNVGAPNRLDFTVIGTAANVAARLSGHCKTLEQSLLLSADIAGYVPDGLRSLGGQELHNVADALEVFVVAGVQYG